MRYLIYSVALALVFLNGCGGKPVSTSANGSWSAELSPSAPQQAGTFTFNLTQSHTTISANSLNFSGLGNLSQCFGSGTTLIGNLGPAMMSGSAVTMTMSFSPVGGVATNTMTMQGNLTPSLALGSGMFTLTGQTSGCSSQTGTFTMTRAPAHAMHP